MKCWVPDANLYRFGHIDESGRSSRTTNPVKFISPPSIAQNPNPRVPLAAVLTFAADESLETRVEITDPDRSWTVMFSADRSPEAGLPILGMRADRDHKITVSLVHASGDVPTATETLHYRTPPLPSGYDFPCDFRINVDKPEKREPGVLLLSVHRIPTGRYQEWTMERSRFGFAWGIIVGLDHDSEVVWYYVTDSFIEGVDRLANGNLLFHRWDLHTFEIDMLGNTINQWYAAHRPQGPVEGAIAVDTAGLHHQPEELPNGNFLIFTASTSEVDDYYTDHFNLNAPRATATVVGDGVAEMDRETGELLWQWSAFDKLDPMRIGYGLTDDYWTLRGFEGAFDWTHGNGASYDERDDSVVISLRHQDALIKVDRQSGEIKWIIGEPDDWGELTNKVLEPVNLTRWPYHGHNPRITPEGTIVFFDNGTWGSRPPNPPIPPEENYSRGVEYRVDEEAMTVEEVWASDTELSDSSCHSPDMGDAHKLPATGNMMVVWAHCVARTPGQVYSSNDRSGVFFNDLTMPSLLREYSRENGTEIVYELEMYDARGLVNWGMYGGLVIPHLYPAC